MAEVKSFLTYHMPLELEALIKRGLVSTDALMQELQLSILIVRSLQDKAKRSLDCI